MSFDRFSLDADRLVAHAQSQGSRSSSPSDDDNFGDASPAPSSHDPYYSNDDIAALHAVVVAAQGILDNAPEPKPLPAAALFKAYDAVLPNYGIDPDTDHHLSTFVFRIGGEKGDGNLTEKFQAILSRMGIVLEFGDNSTESSRPSHPTSPYSFPNQRPNGDRNPAPDDNTTQEVDQPKQRPSLPIGIAPQSVDEALDKNEDREGSQHSGTDQEEETEEGKEEEEELRARARRAALSNVLGRWRSQALPQNGESNLPGNISEVGSQEATYPGRYPTQNGIDHLRRDQLLPNITEEVTEEGRETSVHQLEVKDEASSANMHHNSLQSLLDAPRSMGPASEDFVDSNTRGNHDVKPNFTRKHTLSLSEHESQRNVSGKLVMQRQSPSTSLREHVLVPSVEEINAKVADNEEQSLTERLAVVSSEQQRSGTPPQTPPRSPKEPNTTNPEVRHQKLLKQAARARELYLASKVFNHWADRTARRLEREAVARRHIIRFRYFRLWGQAPAFREPIIEQMRANVAVKKWQRVVAGEIDLERMAQKAADAHRRKTIGRVLDQWSCHHLQHVGQEMTASLTRAKALANWTSQVSENQDLSEAIDSQLRQRLERDAVAKWRNHADLEMSRHAAARRIGTAQQTFNHLREWWDQAELGRRATAYRRYLLTRKACFAFDQWNLRARAQAFLWRREYVSVIQACDKWCQVVAGKEELQHTAERHYGTRAKSKLLRSIRHHQQDMSELVHLEGRALLYLRGTCLLKVLDQTVKQRKDRDKEYVKRYLMARYTQVSSARRKRNFFAALDKWRAFTVQDHVQAREASELKARDELRQQIFALVSWDELAAVDQRRSHEAQVQHIRGMIHAWKEFARDLERHDMEAWQLWASQRQRNCLKEWSIASLQQSGQAHTASEVRRKYDREKRNRYMQHWRYLVERPRPEIGIESPRASTALLQSQGNYRVSWRALSGRRSVIRRNDKMQDFPTNVVETPTRWTGQPSLMSSIMPGSSMAPVREMDEDATSSTMGDDAGIVASPSRKALDRKADRFFALSSTTPRAPVPSYLERDFQDSYNEYEPIESAGTGRASQRFPTGVTQRITPMSTHAELTETESGELPAPFLRPSAPMKSFGYRSTDNRSLGSQPSSQIKSRVAPSKSFGARPSGLRYGVSQSPDLTPSTRSVRIQSPKSFSVTTPRLEGAPRSHIPHRSQQNNHNTMSG